MLGAITGDTIGSRYEFGANRTKMTDFELFICSSFTLSITQIKICNHWLQK